MQKLEFLSLKFEDKAEFLSKHAELISQMVYYECNVSLFLTDHYFVEVFFNREQKQLVSIEIQENAQILYAYVKDLDIRELMKLLQ